MKAGIGKYARMGAALHVFHHTRVENHFSAEQSYILPDFFQEFFRLVLLIFLLLFHCSVCLELR